MKKVQQINTMLPIGLKDDSSVCTTSLRPGALLITLNGLNDRNSLNTCNRNKTTICYKILIRNGVTKYIQKLQYTQVVRLCYNAIGSTKNSVIS